MADEDTPDTGAPADDAKPDTGDTVDWKAEAEKFKALHRKQEERAKANARRLDELEPLAKRAQELEDAGKSDLERLTAEMQSHQSRADKAETDLVRLRVAIRKGLTETQAKRLIGATEDELEADADDLLASFKPAQPEPEETVEEAEPERDPNPRRRPQERLRSGAVPDADPEPDETDPRKLAAMVPRKPFGI
jgi:hypothetical protein